MPIAGSLSEMPTAGSLSEIMPTAVSLSEMPLHMQAPPVWLGSVEGWQQPKERRAGHLTPPPPVKIRSVEPKARRPPSPDLPGEEKPSSDLSVASYGPSQPKKVPKPSWDTDNVMAWRDADLPTPVYVRMDGSQTFHTYHTYPELCWQFQSLGEIQRAVDTHARGTRTGTSKELSYKESVIREFLFWPDGSSSISTRLQIAEMEADDVRRLVQALLDKRNDDELHQYIRQCTNRRSNTD